MPDIWEKNLANLPSTFGTGGQMRIDTPAAGDSVWSKHLAAGQRQQKLSQDYQVSDGFVDWFDDNIVNFGLSTVSSIPELFGTKAPERVEAWRAEHPIWDLTSQLIGIAVPYTGWFKATKLPSLAGKLEGATAGTLKAFGKSTTANPVMAGAVRELFRYTPFELSRLGTGYAIGADMGDMFADVGISQAVAGSLGGVGGFFRAGGKVLEAGGKVAGAEIGLMPTFEYRLAKAPDSTITGNVSREQFIFDKKMEALKYVPEKVNGKRAPYVYQLQGASSETQGFINNTLFKPNPSNIKAEDLAAKPFDVRQLHHDNKAWSVGKDAGDTIAKEAGFEGLDGLAETMVYPRLVKVQDKRFGAGVLGAEMKKLADTGGLSRVSDDLWMGQEDGGLWMVMQRVSKGAEEAAPKTGKRRAAYQFGPAKVRSGDEWLIGKTDLPGRFAKDADKIAKMNVEQWGKYRDPYRQLVSDNPFQVEMNLAMKVLDPTDWAAARSMSKSKWVSRTSPRMASKIARDGSLVGQETIHKMAEAFYDVMAPKAWKMGSDPLYGRFYSMLEAGMRLADEKLNGLTKEVGKLFAKLTPEERQLVTLASQTQTPADDLAKLASSGEISPRAIEAVTQLQNINRSVLDQYVIPALKDAGLDDQIEWLEGYILPRVFKGDHFIRVVDQKGAPQYIASGQTLKEAKDIAAAVVEEAATDGKTWTATEFQSIAMGDADNIAGLYTQVSAQLGQSLDAQKIVQRAIMRVAADKGTKVSKVRPPKTMTKERTGIAGTPDQYDYSLEDVVKASEGHYRQLLRFAAFQSWQSRFSNSMLTWKGANERGYNDVMKRAGQWLGLEGQITQGLNNILKPVFGDLLGGKAATKIANETNGLMYAWNLGILNPSFALLNLLTPFQTVAPWIAFMQKAPRPEVARMMQLDLRFGADGQVVGTMSRLSPLKVMKEAWNLMKNPTPELDEFMKKGLADGTLAPQLYEEFVGASALARADLQKSAAQSGWDFIKNGATWMARKSEEISKLNAFNSAYVLGKNFFGLEGDALYRFMRKGTETTMYGYKTMDRARVMTGPLGSMFGLFKNWQVHFIGQMADYAGVGMRDGVWEPMLWQWGSAMAIGGMGAVPLIHLADGLAKWQSESPNSYHWLRDNWNSTAADTIYFGLPGLIGMSLQASSAIPGTDVRNEINSLMNFVAFDRAQQAWQGVGAAWEYAEQSGQNPLKNSNIRDQLLSAFAPRAMFRAMSAAEGDFIKSMRTGYPTVRDLPVATRLLHGLGINQTEIEQHYIAGESAYREQERERAAIQGLGEMFAQGQMYGDREQMTAAVKRAMATGVPVDSVLQSAQTRLGRERDDDHLSRFDKSVQADWSRVLRD